MATNPKADMHVLVIGAGATGLLIAHGLKKAGINVSVFEHEASAQLYRPREWTMALHWGLPLLESLLPDRMRPELAKEAYVDPALDWGQSPCNLMRMYNGVTGEIIKDFPVDGKLVRVSRRKLRTFLAQEIDIEYDHQLIDIKHGLDGVTGVFANGIEVKGSLIVGADGPKSAVRDVLLGPDKAAARPLENVIHCNTSFCPGDAERAKFIRSAHPVFSMAMHPDMFTFLSITESPEPEKPETWRFQVVTGWLGDREAFTDNVSRLAEIKRRASSICEPFRSAVLWLPDDTPAAFDAINYWQSIPWDTKDGRITLAGDAAHPMPPHRGQGLNHAIQDAYNLVNVLIKSTSDDTNKDDLAKKIQAYSDEVANRGNGEVNMSRQSAFMSLNWNTLMDSPVVKHALNRSPNADQQSQAVGHKQNGHVNTNGHTRPNAEEHGDLDKGKQASTDTKPETAKAIVCA